PVCGHLPYPERSMTREPGDPGPDDPTRATDGAHRNNVRDSDNSVEAERIAGDVVQTRDVQGGIHLHIGQPTPAVFSVVPRQLPGDVQAFVNRERELAELGAATGAGHGGTAGGVAVLVITGSAGVGKTALALHWAHRNRHLFPDGEIYL